MAVCSECNAKLRDDDIYCPKCGHQVTKNKQLFCCRCGAKIPSGESFCSKCGTKVGTNINYDNYDSWNSQQPATYHESNTMAMVGFVLAFFIPLLGLIFSCIGYSKSKYLNGDGKDMSMAGIILSSVFIAIGIISVIIYIAYISSLP